MRGAGGFLATLQRASFAAMDHDALTLGQATAYSAVVAVFPGLIVAAAVVALLPETVPMRLQLAHFFDRVLPSNVVPVVEAYFTATHKNPQTTWALVSAAAVSLTGAISVLGTLMEGFRRAHHLPLGRKSFWRRRLRALALVPLSVIPMALATSLVVFGHLITHWLVGSMAGWLQGPIGFVTIVTRWSIALAGSVGIIAVLYHLGTDVNVHVREHFEPMMREPLVVLRKEWTWRASLPGAVVATGLWFVATLLFGLYVTRFANYSQVYGSLGAAIALMVWLYIIALCVLIGSEFNAQLHFAKRREEKRLFCEVPTISAVEGAPTVPADR